MAQTRQLLLFEVTRYVKGMVNLLNQKEKVATFVASSELWFTTFDKESFKSKGKSGHICRFWVMVK